jgi:hypothetical protein
MRASPEAPVKGINQDDEKDGQDCKEGFREPDENVIGAEFEVV